MVKVTKRIRSYNPRLVTMIRINKIALKMKCWSFLFSKKIGLATLDSLISLRLLGQTKPAILQVIQRIKSKTPRHHKFILKQLTLIKRKLNSRKRLENLFNQILLIRTFSKRKAILNIHSKMKFSNPNLTIISVRTIKLWKWPIKIFKCNNSRKKICGIAIKMIATNLVPIFLYSPKSLY